MHLRRLQDEDVNLMYEWMMDNEISKSFHTDFSGKKIEDASEFITHSMDNDRNKYFAIASDDNIYMGTVALKNYDPDRQHIEFSIVVRRESMGKGYAWFGTRAAIERAFSEYDVTCVYWGVKRENIRAITFFDKHGFREAVDVPVEIKSRYPKEADLKWYSVLRDDNLDDKYDSVEGIDGCSVIHINTIPTIGAGELSFIESKREIGFETKRIYYISKVPEGQRRGFHAHKKLKQLIFCPYGRVEIKLDDGIKHGEIVLSDPSIGICLEKPVWREMLWLVKDSVLCVVASDYYDEDDYIRDYSYFKTFKGIE